MEFKIEKSFASYPSDQGLLAFINNTQYDFETVLGVDEITMEVIQKSFLTLHIHYSELEYTLISEQPSLSAIDLIANIGGSLGLFIGISLLSFLEIVEILIEIGSILFGNMCKSRGSYENNRA